MYFMRLASRTGFTIDQSRCALKTLAEHPFTSVIAMTD